MYPVITINREFGSGGHSIGEEVAKRLNIPFYDGQIVERCSIESGYAKEIIEEQGEQASNSDKWFNFPSVSYMYYQTPQDEIYLAQRRVIMDIAKEGPCVIVGRCSDYILEYANPPIKCAHVLIHADYEHREKRILEKYGEVDGVDIKKRIAKKDKQRRAYYHYYTDRSWGDYNNYNLSLDSGKLGEELCVYLICEMAKKLG